MQIDFKSPQRQSILGIVIMFADTLQGVIRAMWAPLLIILIKLEPEKYIIVGLSFIGIVILVAIIAFLRYRNFTFFLDEDNQEFILSKGILNKSRINIQLSKIQQVNINQSIIQKIVGVYSLDIDTAGTDKKEISIRAIDQDLALILKERLLDFDNKEEVLLDENQKIISKENNTSKPFIKISYVTLFKVGITSKYGRTIAILITFIITLYQTFKDAVDTFELDESQVDSVFEQRLGMASVIVLIFVLFIVVLLINIARTFIKHFDFEIVKQKNSLVVTSGLFAKKNTLLNPLKVQITSFSQNFFQRKLKILDMNMKQASNSEVEDKQKKSNVIEVPGCDAEERNEILKIILGKIPEKGQEFSPNFRYLIFRILFAILVPATIVVLQIIFALENIFFYFPFILAYFVIASFLIYFGYKNYRLYSNSEFIVLKHGAWDVENEIIQPHKIQGITTKQYFWHKSSDVGHLTLHTAAGDVHFHFGNFTEIKQLVNYWLYQVETSTENWM